MDLVSIKSLAAVVERGSIKAAADALGISRSTLRRRLSDFERAIGAPLFDRTDKGIEATAAGAVLINRGRVMMQEADSVLTAIRAQSDSPSGTLKVLVPMGLPPDIAVPFIGKLRAAHPRLRLHIIASIDPVGDLDESIDLALVIGRELPVGPWMAKTLVNIEERLLASPFYTRSRGVPSTLEELAGHTIQQYDSPGVVKGMLPTFGGEPVPVFVQTESTDFNLILELIIAGAGMSVLPMALTRNPSPSKPLQAFLPDLIGRRRPLRIIWSEANHKAPRIRLFIEELALLSASLKHLQQLEA